MSKDLAQYAKQLLHQSTGKPPGKQIVQPTGIKPVKMGIGDGHHPRVYDTFLKQLRKLKAP